ATLDDGSMLDAIWGVLSPLDPSGAAYIQTATGSDVLVRLRSDGHVDALPRPSPPVLGTYPWLGTFEGPTTGATFSSLAASQLVSAAIASDGTIVSLPESVGDTLSATPGFMRLSVQSDPVWPLDGMHVVAVRNDGTLAEI